MLWGAISYEYTSDLVPMQGDPNAPRGGVTARVYLDLLEQYLPTVMDYDSTFMHDNASIHRAYIVREWLEEEGIPVLDWPAYSPDLNPIKNMWPLLKTGLLKDHAYLTNAPKNDETIRQLKRAAVDVWSRVRDSTVNKCIDSMPERIQEVIDAHGWYTRF
jgi:transposase